MTREEFKIITKDMLKNYSNAPVKTPQAFEMWFELIKDMDYKTVDDNLRHHMTTKIFAPTIAELKGAVDTKDFNNFNRRRYNMAELELKLLERDRPQMIEVEAASREEGDQND